MLAKKVVGVAVFWSSFFMCRAGRARHVTSFSLLFLILFLPFHFFLLPCSYADYADGDGSPEFPYQIAEPNQLIYMSEHSEDWDKHFILTADINLALADPNTFTTALIAPDGSAFFTGVFDGNSHKIYNLTIDTAGLGNDYLGLFGRIENGTIRNLVLKDTNIRGGNDSRNLGCLVGYSYYGNIRNCYASGNVTGYLFISGLVGWNWYGNINDCFATGTVNGIGFSGDLGGLVGRNYNGNINNCYSTGNVNGRGSLGGLVGYHNYGYINNCFAMGDVNAGNNSQHLGGLVGHNYLGQIENCYSTGNVTTIDGIYIGGLVGENHGNIRYCYATGLAFTEGNTNYIGGLVGFNYAGSGISYGYYLHPDDGGGPDNGLGTPLHESDMKIISNFAWWDFVGYGYGTEDHWQMCVDGYDYPRLAWQFNSPADFLHPGRVDNYDLTVFTHDWLSIDSRCCDIYPPEGDNIVNLFDYIEFARYWLKE